MQVEITVLSVDSMVQRRRIITVKIRWWAVSGLWDVGVRVGLCRRSGSKECGGECGCVHT